MGCCVKPSGAGDYLFLMMELMSSDMASRLHDDEQEALSEGQRLALLLDVCAGMEFLHSKGIIHRDLKPQNVLLDAKGRAKITGPHLYSAPFHDIILFRLPGHSSIIYTFSSNHGSSFVYASLHKLNIIDSIKAASLFLR